jgi:tetratricopeptide (TPR) repeat protein
MTVPWEENNQRVTELLDQGRQARDAGQLAEAAALFRQAYDLEPSAFAASRYLHCLRRQGPEKARAAVRFAREPVERWPMETWLIREYVWAIYDGYLKANGGTPEEEEAPAEERPGFEVRVKAARRILKLSREELPRTRAVLAICRVAKARREWATVLEFAQALDPESLSDETREQDGRSLPSDRQQWLGHVTRACLELERYEECRRFACEGMERYPNVMLFPWWHGLARVRGGEAEAGLRDLEEIERRFVAPWYVRRDIGEVYERLGRDADAWGWYCAAARSSGEMRSRIPMLARMGQLLERLDRCSLALDHVLLAWAMAAREEQWAEFAARSREEVEAFLVRHAAEPGLSHERPDAPPDPEPLLARCRQAWVESRISA